MGLGRGNNGTSGTEKRSLIPLMAYDEMFDDEGIDDAGLLVYLDHWLTVTALRRYRME